MPRPSSIRWGRRSLVLGTAVTAVLGLTAPAQAAVTATTTATTTTTAVACATRTTAQKFLAVDGDPSAYFTAPSGTFESGTTGWALTGASVVTGNESYHVDGASNAKSLQLASNGKAVSPLFCNQSGERSLRFFVKGSAGAQVHLHIDVSNSGTQNRSTLDWQTSVPAGGWGAANGIMVPDLYSQGYENLQLTFTATGGTVQLDDVEVDPFKPL